MQRVSKEMSKKVMIDIRKDYEKKVEENMGLRVQEVGREDKERKEKRIKDEI